MALKTITKHMQYRVCDECGKVRVGTASTDWPAAQDICPPCAEEAQSVQAPGLSA